MDAGKIAGLALGSFMAAVTAAQAQPVPELYGREGIPDNNKKINCVREAMYYFAGGQQNGMLQSTFDEGAKKIFMFETSDQDGETVGFVEVTGGIVDIDVIPLGRNQTERQQVMYSYITSCDPSIKPVAP